MADVTTKIITANNVKNGTAVTTALPSGKYNTKEPVISDNTDLTAVENKYTAKYVKTYYEYNT